MRQQGEGVGAHCIEGNIPKIQQASETDDELLVHEIDLDMVREVRNNWQFFRDRRPETYTRLTDGE